MNEPKNIRLQQFADLALELLYCFRFSPNIEVSCLDQVYEHSLKHLYAAKMNLLAVHEAKKVLDQSYHDYRVLLVPSPNSARRHIDNEIKAQQAKLIAAIGGASEALAQSIKQFDKVEINYLLDEGVQYNADPSANIQEAHSCVFEVGNYYSTQADYEF